MYYRPNPSLSDVGVLLTGGSRWTPVMWYDVTHISVWIRPDMIIRRLQKVVDGGKFHNHM